MIFKYSDNTKSGSGLEEVKRIINFHLNRRPNQGQQKQGQKRKGQEEQEEDLRDFVEWKKAKNNAGKVVGEKGRDRGTGGSGGGNSSRGVGDQGDGKFYNYGTCTINHYHYQKN